MQKKQLRYQTVLFDLDGTLIESGPGIFAAINAMLVDVGREALPEKDLYPLVGPPLRTGFRELLHLPSETADEQISLYRKHYQEEFHSLIHPFPGMIKLLEDLKAAGVRIGIVTSKAEQLAADHIRDMGLSHCISYLCGATADGRGEKPDLLRRAVQDLNLIGSALTTAAMVGDRMYDLEGANAVGMDGIGVLYGYGSRAELEACKPKHIVETVEQLSELLIEA